MTELEKAYMVMQDECGIEAGDTVKVLRIASDGQWGWGSVWTQEMDCCVGKIGVVRQVIEIGISVSIDGDWWNYPFFVLEKIPKTHWRDTVSPENPVLCYVRDNGDGEWRERPILVVNYENPNDTNYPYRGIGCFYMQAKRVPKSVIESMLKAYDETSEDE